MEKNVVNWFEIPVLNLERAKKFYSELLNVSLENMEMPMMKMAAFPMIQGGEYSTGALVEGQGYEPTTNGTLVYFACNDVNEQLDKVENLGGKQIMPKTSIGEHGFVARITDTEGNQVALHSVK